MAVRTSRERGKQGLRLGQWKTHLQACMNKENAFALPSSTRYYFSSSEANRVLKEVLAGFFIGHTQYHLIADVETLHYVRGHDDLSASHYGL
jgi:hypothetical protein